MLSNCEQIAEEAWSTVNVNGQNAEEVCSDVDTEKSSASVELELRRMWLSYNKFSENEDSFKMWTFYFKRS